MGIGRPGILLSGGGYDKQPLWKPEFWTPLRGSVCARLQIRFSASAIATRD
jgi:hypothetical protein